MNISLSDLISASQLLSDQAPAAAADLSDVTKNMSTLVCSIQNRDECFSCGS